MQFFYYIAQAWSTLVVGDARFNIISCSDFLVSHYRNGGGNQNLGHFV